MINELVYEALFFGKKRPPDNRTPEEKTQDDLKKLSYGKPYSNKNIVHQHLTGDVLPTAITMFMAKKRKK